MKAPEPLADRPACPSCGERRSSSFHQVAGVPVHSVRLVASEAEARAFPQHRIDLHFCEACGFIFNACFDPTRQAYGEDYEETQGYSATFQTFQRELAESLIRRHDLRGRHLLEIGCGKGEFISLLCELGGNTGLAFDPAYLPARNSSPARDRVRWVPTFFPPGGLAEPVDFACCKMTLEHVGSPARLVRSLRDSPGVGAATTVFFQIPEMRRILREAAYWDIYYEHCSYFTPGSLGRLFRSCGFAVERLWTDYDDQYLMIEARSCALPAEPHPAEEPVAELAAEVAAFTRRLEGLQDRWRAVLGQARAEGQRIVLWGGGSKAVAFLCAMEDSSVVLGAVDINPHKHGTYLAGVGHRILAPAELPALRPDLVVVMNPVYLDEIASALGGLDLRPTLYPIDAPERPVRL